MGFTRTEPHSDVQFKTCAIIQLGYSMEVFDLGAGTDPAGLYSACGAIGYGDCTGVEKPKRTDILNLLFGLKEEESVQKGTDPKATSQAPAHV